MKRRSILKPQNEDFTEDLNFTWKKRVSFASHNIIKHFDKGGESFTIDESHIPMNGGSSSGSSAESGFNITSHNVDDISDMSLSVSMEIDDDKEESLTATILDIPPSQEVEVVQIDNTLQGDNDSISLVEMQDASSVDVVQMELTPHKPSFHSSVSIIQEESEGSVMMDIEMSFEKVDEKATSPGPSSPIPPVPIFVADSQPYDGRVSPAKPQGPPPPQSPIPSSPVFAPLSQSDMVPGTPQGTSCNPAYSTDSICSMLLSTSTASHSGSLQRLSQTLLEENPSVVNSSLLPSSWGRPDCVQHQAVVVESNDLVLEKARLTQRLVEILAKTRHLEMQQNEAKKPHRYWKSMAKVNPHFVPLVASLTHYLRLGHPQHRHSLPSIVWEPLANLLLAEVEMEVSDDKPKLRRVLQLTPRACPRCPSMMNFTEVLVSRVRGSWEEAVLGHDLRTTIQRLRDLLLPYEPFVSDVLATCSLGLVDIQTLPVDNENPVFCCVHVLLTKKRTILHVNVEFSDIARYSQQGGVRVSVVLDERSPRRNESGVEEEIVQKVKELLLPPHPFYRMYNAMRALLASTFFI